MDGPILPFVLPRAFIRLRLFMTLPQTARRLGMLVLALVVVGVSLQHRPPSDPVLINQPTLGEVRQYEGQFGSERAPLPAPESEAALSAEELAAQCPPAQTQELQQRVHYHRPSTAMPPGRVRYFASADSVVQCVSYTWDESHTLSGREMVERLSQGGVDPDTVIARYDFAFDEVVRSVRGRLGAPDALDPQPIADTAGARKQYRRHAQWRTPTVVIDLTLNVSLLGGQIQVDQYWR